MLRRFIAYTFPTNLEKFHQCARQLRSHFPNL
jgi:hypothetical protein